MNKLSLHLSIWLAVHRANEPGSITVTPSVTRATSVRSMGNGFFHRGYTEVNEEWILPQGYKAISFTQNSCLKNIIFSATSLEVKVTSYPGCLELRGFPQCRTFSAITRTVLGKPDSLCVTMLYFVTLFTNS